MPSLKLNEGREMSQEPKDKKGQKEGPEQKQQKPGQQQQDRGGGQQGGQGGRVEDRAPWKKQEVTDWDKPQPPGKQK